MVSDELTPVPRMARPGQRRDRDPAYPCFYRTPNERGDPMGRLSCSNSRSEPYWTMYRFIER